MPYFKEIDTLFIHIPKTGGSNIENYIFHSYKLKKNINNLLSFNNIDNINIKINSHSLQHMTYNEIYENKDFFNINIEDTKLKIFTVVRNPYDRIISDLLFLKLIENSSSKKYIENQIYIYIKNKYKYDNHKIPQNNYLINNKNILEERIKILKTETLNNDMKELGFCNFEKYCNYTKYKKYDYNKYLTDKSIEMINNYYKKDFELFNYNMI